MSTEQSGSVADLQILKPAIDMAAAKEVILQHFGIVVEVLKELPAYDDRNFKCKDAKTGQLYVFKALNHIYTRDELEIHNNVSKLLKTLADQGFPTQNVYNSKIIELPTKSSGLKESLCRLMTYLPGQDLSTLLPLTKNVFTDVGRYMKKLHGITLPQFNNPTGNCPVDLDPIKARAMAWATTHWDVTFSDSIHNVSDPEIHGHILQIHQAFRAIKSKLTDPATPKCMIHSDMNLQNLLGKVSDSDTGETLDGEITKTCEIVGIIDFNDTNYTSPAVDIGTTVAYFLNNNVTHHGNSVIGDVVKLIMGGYEPDEELTALLKDTLFEIVTSRGSMSVIGAFTGVKEQPWNEEYLMVDAKPAMNMIRAMMPLGKTAFNKLVWG